MKSAISMVMVLVASLLFLAVSNPKTYNLTNKLPMVTTEDSDGVPTLAGLGLHAAVFAGLLALSGKVVPMVAAKM